MKTGRDDAIKDVLELPELPLAHTSTGIENCPPYRLKRHGDKAIAMRMMRQFPCDQNTMCNYYVHSKVLDIKKQ